ncbi:MAG: exodeoxyribonuclease V subunit alpha [Castellaniella sp.]|uniref:exodeoxyribonuclease V subunit alpha n=1 Tax=Castellaniella sp. TaxID=1955812 RepID=UPI003C734B7D
MIEFPAWLAFESIASSEDDVRDLDVAFGRLLARQAPQAPELALRLAVLCSARLAHGHPCLDLQALCEPDRAASDGLDAGDAARRTGPPDWAEGGLDACLAALAEAGFVGPGEGPQPLVLHGHRLYLARYWRAGRRIREDLGRRLELEPPEAHDPARVRAWLDAVFTAPVAAAPDWQKIACATALLHGFAIVTGGPGTGKTTTVVRLLAVLQGLARERGLARGLRIRLAAPTGKAAARLNESIAGALERLAGSADADLAAALARVPAEVLTLHRLLGSRPDTRRLKFHAGNPLDLDLLVVDEASMMDIEMMDAVLAALPAHARLVLLGDKDQLASVEAGAVLGELCERAEDGHYTPAQCRRLLACSGEAVPDAWQDPDGTALDQAVVMLRHSHRFQADSGIGRFAVAVNQGDVQAVAGLLRHPPDGLSLVRTGSPAAPGDAWLRDSGVLDAAAGYPALLRAVRDGRPDLQAPPSQWDRWAREVLVQQTRFQVLCALRDGPWGARGLNQRIESRLRAEGWIPVAEDAWYPGRPVLVLRNHAALGLANGDIGVVLPVPDPERKGDWMMRVAFAGATRDAVRWVSPARLPEVETVYALTVHKSQGSEFDRVALVLPDNPSPLLTRELLYTGATRARHALALVLPGGDALLEDAVLRRTRRAGGIWSP